MNTNAAQPEQDRSYYSQQRNDVVAFLDPRPGLSVLDVGCGTGGLGQSLRRAGCRPVVGIEIEAWAAQEAARHYDRVYTADVDAFDPPFAEGSFDRIVCADVLEHLRDPWAVLARLRRCLKPDGTLVASIPNIGNAQTIRELLQGRFDYMDWGIMDRGHLRFFTRETIVEMFAGAGYAVKEIRGKNDPNAERILAFWRSQDLPRRIRELVELMGAPPFTPTDEDLRRMLTVQYFVIASPEGQKP